jgi:mannose/fructose/N-acetylgalactosamine-specific phosphotransferase system component IID
LALQSFSLQGAMNHIRTSVIASRILGLLVVGAMMARRLHVSGQEDAALIAQIQTATADLPEDAAAVVEAHSSGHPLLLSYALQPR